MKEVLNKEMSVKYALLQVKGQAHKLICQRGVAPRRNTYLNGKKRKAMEKIIYDYYSNLFGIHVRLSPFNERKDDYVVPNVLHSEIRHEIASVRNRTAPGPNSIRSEHLNNLLPVLIEALSRCFTRYLSDCKVSSQ
ncbi:hypothetical protein DICVIV_13409 [Dictyocaulus viviparus]|uniref:Uncharacterized protein n=1 Tax=Dictyocaulus viviparus TaxID=29172 RepID=A0A0D8X7T9_DICVI|nr:hypothetical protein DICVIV_13409 [Dictyocaulus viviparus]